MLAEMHSSQREAIREGPRSGYQQRDEWGDPMDEHGQVVWGDEGAQTAPAAQTGVKQSGQQQDARTTPTTLKPEAPEQELITTKVFGEQPGSTYGQWFVGGTGAAAGIGWTVLGAGMATPLGTLGATAAALTGFGLGGKYLFLAAKDEGLKEARDVTAHFERDARRRWGEFEGQTYDWLNKTKKDAMERATSEAKSYGDSLFKRASQKLEGGVSAVQDTATTLLPVLAGSVLLYAYLRR